MTSTHLNLKEEDVVRLALEFFHNRDLHITQLSLERETGIINGNYADDVLFLRQLILDGQWDNVLEFAQPLSALKEFKAEKFNYAILRHKYMELLCIRSETEACNDAVNAVEEVVKVLSDLEKLAPSKDEYANLCLLLSVPSIKDHDQFKKWNPSNARVQCFREVYPLVETFLPGEKKPSNTISNCAKNDRLMQLLIKGILYESCVNFCAAKATESEEAHSNVVTLSKLLDGPGFETSDLNLLSWLQSVPSESFVIPFQHRLLNVNVEKLERPSLQTSWTEHMLVTPIKPSTFPHMAMPFRRPRSAADVMTRSLRPLPDGPPKHPDFMAISAIDCSPSTSCFAGFHLTNIKGNKLMNVSVDRLFNGKTEESNFNAHKEVLNPIDERLSSNNTVKPSRSTAMVTSTPKPNADYAASTSKPNAAASSEPLQLLKVYQIQKKRECDLTRQLQNMEFVAEASSNEMTDLESTMLSPITDEPREHSGFARADKIADRQEMRDTASGPAAASSRVVGHKEDLRPNFKPVTVLEDLQAVRCAEFHPNGKLYAVGSNTKTLRICTYPKIEDINDFSVPKAPTVLLKRTKHHVGSIYCLAWNPSGDLLATGSNDKTVKLMRFDSHSCTLEKKEVELTMHDGTVRDLCFIEETSSSTSVLVSGGAGDCKICVTDCETALMTHQLSGHTGTVLSLYSWGGTTFVSGSQDKTVRFWDLRTGNCLNIISPPTGDDNTGSAVTSLAVDPTGRLLVCGHEDGSSTLYDVRGSRLLQRFIPHLGDVRSVRFAPGFYYLLTAGYDGRVVLNNLKGDLTRPLPSAPIARHLDKVTSARWHPVDYSFLSTSADRTVVLWTMPPP